MISGVRETFINIREWSRGSLHPGLYYGGKRIYGKVTVFIVCRKASSDHFYSSKDKDIKLG